MRNNTIVLIAAGLLSVVPAQARWAGGCGSYGNPPCSLCRELKAQHHWKPNVSGEPTAVQHLDNTYNSDSMTNDGQRY